METFYLFPEQNYRYNSLSGKIDNAIDAYETILSARMYYLATGVFYKDIRRRAQLNIPVYIDRTTNFMRC